MPLDYDMTVLGDGMLVETATVCDWLVWLRWQAEDADRQLLLLAVMTDVVFGDVTYAATRRQWAVGYAWDMRGCVLVAHGAAGVVIDPRFAALLRDINAQTGVLAHLQRALLRGEAFAGAIVLAPNGYQRSSGLYEDPREPLVLPPAVRAFLDGLTGGGSHA